MVNVGLEASPQKGAKSFEWLQINQKTVTN